MASTAKAKKVFRWIYRTVFVLVNNLYCIPTYVVWCFLLHPLYFVNPEWYWMIEGQFFQWLLTMVAYWSYSAGYYIVETGDPIDHLISEETLVLANHQSTSDVPLLMHAFSAKNGLLQKLNWIMDAVFQYTNFGIVSTLHGDFFINAGRDRRDASLRDLEHYLKGTFIPRERKWLLLFPEGGFLRKRKDASKRYAEKMKLPNLEHVTLPRLGALQTIIDTLAPPTKPLEGTGDWKKSGNLKYIIDMTIAYPDGEPLDLGTIITGHLPSCKVHMHYKVYRVNEVPCSNPDELQSWLYNRYIEKNNILSHYYKTGVWNPESYKNLLDRSLLLKEKVCSPVENNEKAPPSDKDVVDDACRSPPNRLVLGEDYLSRSAPPPLTKGDEKPVETELLQGRLGKISPSDNECIYEALSESEFDELSSSNSKTLQLDLLRISLLHVMFLTSTMLHCTAFRIVFHLIFGGTA